MCAWIGEKKKIKENDKEIVSCACPNEENKINTQMKENVLIKLSFVFLLFPQWTWPNGRWFMQVQIRCT